MSGTGRSAGSGGGRRTPPGGRGTSGQRSGQGSARGSGQGSGQGAGRASTGQGAARQGGRAAPASGGRSTASGRPRTPRPTTTTTRSGGLPTATPPRASARTPSGASSRGDRSARPAAPARVERRRRWPALLAVAAVAVTGVAAAAVWTGRDAGPETHKVAPPDPLDLTGAPSACAPSAVRLTLTADRTTVAPSEPVAFTATITNIGRKPCLVDGADASRAVTVTSGTDRVWSSADCSDDSRMLLLGEGDTDTQTVRWSRVRSAEGCASGLPAPGAGQYQAVVTLADVPGATSEPVVLALVDHAGQQPPAPAPTGTPETGEAGTAAPGTGAATTDDGAEPATGSAGG